MITAEVTGRSRMPVPSFPEDIRITPEDTLFLHTGGGLWMADPAFWTETEPGRSCMMRMVFVPRAETVFSVEVKTDTEAMRTLRHPMIGEPVDCGLLLMVQVLVAEEPVYTRIWGGCRDWEPVSVSLPAAASVSVIFVAADYPGRMFDPDMPWPAAPEGHTPTNLIHVRNIAISPAPYGPPGFSVASHPVGPERSRIEAGVFSVRPGPSPATHQGRIRTVGRCAWELRPFPAGGKGRTDLATERRVFPVASWRNPCPPSVAVPATEEQHSNLGLVLHFKPDVRNARPAIAEMTLPGDGNRLVCVMQAKPGAPAAPYNGYSGIQRIQIEQHADGGLVPLLDWNAGANPPGLHELPGSIREYDLPLIRMDEVTIRISVWPNAYAAEALFIFPPEVAIGAVRTTGLASGSPAAILVSSPPPVLQWRLPAESAATAQVIYTCSLSGAEAGLPDLNLAMTSFACRLRTDTPSYLSVTVPARDGLADAIAARKSGTLRVFKGYRLISGYTRTEEIARGKYDRVSASGGGRSASLTLVGYHRYGTGSGALRPLSEISVKGHDMEGRRTVRAAVDMWMRPGDVAVWGAQSMVVGAVAIHVSVDRASMDLTEA